MAKDLKPEVIVRVRGVMLDSADKARRPSIETRVKAEHASSLRFSPFTQGLLWGMLLSLVVSGVGMLALAWHLGWLR